MTDEKPQEPTPPPEPKPAQPPPGMLDMDKVRFWAGRSTDRRNRPAYSLKAMD